MLRIKEFNYKDIERVNKRNNQVNIQEEQSEIVKPDMDYIDRGSRRALLAQFDWDNF